MKTENTFSFSHNEIEESATQTKTRIEKSTAICQATFIGLIGDIAHKRLIKSFGALGDTFKSGNVIYVSIQNIDHVFKS